jgi:hypothetical protein
MVDGVGTPAREVELLGGAPVEPSSVVGGGAPVQKGGGRRRKKHRPGLGQRRRQWEKRRRYLERLIAESQRELKLINSTRLSPPPD